MIGLPQILNSKYVRGAILQFLKNREPPMVSYSYTRTISGAIFNQRSVVEELDVDGGIIILRMYVVIVVIVSIYCYEPAGQET